MNEPEYVTPVGAYLKIAHNKARGTVGLFIFEDEFTSLEEAYLVEMSPEQVETFISDLRDSLAKLTQDS